MADAAGVMRQELSVGEKAVEAVNALVSCLNAQQKLTSTFARMLSGEQPDQSTMDQTGSDVETACTEAQIKTQTLRDTQRQ